MPVQRSRRLQRGRSLSEVSALFPSSIFLGMNPIAARPRSRTLALSASLFVECGHPFSSRYPSPTRSPPALGSCEPWTDALLGHSASQHPTLTHIISWSPFSPVVLKHRERRRGCALRRGGLLLRYRAGIGLGSSRFAGTLQESRPWHLGAASRSRPSGGVP